MKPNSPDLSDLLKRVGAELTVGKRNKKPVLGLSRFIGGGCRVSAEESRFIEDYRPAIIEYLKRRADFRRAEAELTARLQEAVGQGK
jgi:hypothetical protein